MTTFTEMPKYAAYKDSGVDWLGEIPEEWSTRKVKYLFRIGRGRVISQQELDDNGCYPVYSSQTQNDGILGYISTFDFDCEQITWTTDGANAGTVFLRKGKHNCTNVCGTLQPINKQKISLEFLKNALSIAAQFYKRPDTNGAKIMNGEMAEIFVTFPPLEAQTAIANFLDEKTAKIDEAIAIKEKQIELLKERKQIIIQQAVTQGLDPTVPMKDSGVEWIGQIPAHWEMKPLKLHLKKIIDNRGRTPAFGDNGIPMLEVKNITDGDLYPTEQFDKFVIPSVVEKYERDKVAIGDVLISTVGATSGKTVLIKNSPTYFICQNVVGLRPDIDLGSEFLNYTLSAVYFKTSLQMINKGNTIDNLKVSVFINNTIVMPPLQEQEKIAAHIELESRKTNNAIDIFINQINKLKEYKTTLINSAVTGKIKVV